MQHEYSKMTQWFFAIIFATFAVAGPVIGVTFRDSFGLRAQFAASERESLAHISSETNQHTGFFCSEWAGNCREQLIIQKVNRILKK